MNSKAWLLGSIFFGQLVGQQPPQAPEDLNYQACLRGQLICDMSRLTAAQLNQVSVIAKKRNYEKCLAGSPTCDPLLMSKEESEILQGQVRIRNLQKCMQGASSCDPLLLTKSEAQAARAAADSR